MILTRQNTLATVWLPIHGWNLCVVAAFSSLSCRGLVVWANWKRSGPPQDVKRRLNSTDFRHAEEFSFPPQSVTISAQTSEGSVANVIVYSFYQTCCPETLSHGACPGSRTGSVAPLEMLQCPSAFANLIRCKETLREE